MKAAVCSSDGSHVDLHFGKTSVFYIFEIENGLKTMIGKRSIDKYSPSEMYLKEGNESHEFDRQKFDKVYEVISDCGKIYTTSIGDVPKHKLEEKGIAVQLCNCPVNMIPTCSGNCKS